MGKYDGLLKYLGKEDSFTPEQVRKGIDAEAAAVNLNDLSDITPESMENVEKLISGSAVPGEAAKAPAGDASEAPDNTVIDEEVLNELSNLDMAPPNIQELINRKMAESQGSQGADLTAPPPEEMGGEVPHAEVESAPVNLFEPQFRSMPEMEAATQEEEVQIPQDNQPAMESIPDMGEFSVPESAPEAVSEPTPEAGLADMFQELQGIQGQNVSAEEAAVPAMEEFPQMGAEAPEVSALPEMPDFGIPSEEHAVESFQGLDMPSEPAAPAESADLEIPDFSSITGPEAEPSSAPAPDELNIPDFDMPMGEEKPAEMPDFSAMQEPAVVPEISEFSDIKDEFSARPASKDVQSPDFMKSKKEQATGFELDHDKATKIRNRINKLYDPLLRKKVRHAIMESNLPADLFQQLVAMLLLNEDEEKIRSFVDQHVSDTEISGKESAFAEAAEEEKRARAASAPKRRVIYTEETKRAKQFQGEFQNFTKYSFVLIVLAVLAGFIFRQLIWIPFGADRHYNRGLADLKRGDFQKSELEFDAGKKISGPNAKWSIIFATNYINMNQYTLATNKLIDYLNYDPLHVETIYVLANFYKNNVYPPKFQEAVNLYKRLYDRSKDNFDFLDHLGMTYIEWGDRTSGETDRFKLYSEANSLYQNYLSKNKKHVGSYYRLLDIALRIGQPDKIDQIYDRIDELNPKAVNIKTLTDLGRYYTDKRRLDRARLVYNKLMPSNPQYDESYYEYGRFLTINYDFFNAMKAVSNSIILNPKSGKAYNLLGELYYLSDTLPNNKLLAKENFENAIKFSPNYYKPYANLGNVYYNDSQNFPNPEEALGKAFESYKTARLYIPPDTKDYYLYYNLGWLYYHNKMFEEAEKEFGVIYTEDPHNPIVSYNMGNTYVHLNRLTLAEVEFWKAIDYFQVLADKISYINPNLDRHKEIYGQLARSYNNRGVVYALLFKKTKKKDYEKKALLDFYKAKDNASKINSIYNFSEYNIKYILNKGIRNREPALDDEILKRSTLKKMLEEERTKLVETL